ncbi:hypothetical protein SSBR45G_11450 [Bradyrhizobium sp. SSBR45G]|nr:hypothetical protein SSBR45G_11450 [Bradyrhizobium sp. SSBR45G]GLH83279.1 hypothetical protein SSBR45R_07390 [Bradyrhizobium sp. SSBR45R]
MKKLRISETIGSRNLFVQSLPVMVSARKEPHACDVQTQLLLISAEQANVHDTARRGPASVTEDRPGGGQNSFRV